jgi:hypothetical protein
MDYNWVEIFSSKSDKELYQIYQGKSFLPKSAIPFAEEELHKRGFDFNNMELNSELWRLTDIEEEMDFLSQRNLEKPIVSFKQYVFVVLAITLFTIIVFSKLLETKTLLIILLAGIAFPSLLILSNNRDYNKRINHLNELIEKKKTILNKISIKEDPKEKQQILNELSKQSKARIEERKLINKNISIVMLVVLLIYLIINFFV